ncbi:MAG: zinc-ribbon domain-containing protein [Muribaculaceae bacterium]|nr:zinc-ribbon domain-containing protein [Muribaculaceae bacterium]
MKLKCPKCGKVTEVSAVELRKQRGNVVCPRCLAVFKEPVPADAGDDDEALTPPPVPSPRRAAASAPSRHRPISFVAPPEPPRPRARQPQPYRQPRPSRPRQPRIATPPPLRPRSHTTPLSYWGCLGYSALATIVFFLLYILVGKL